MKLEDEVRLSFYKEISILRDFPKIAIVQHVDTGRIFVQKNMYLHNITPFRQLQSTHISGIPDVYNIIEYACEDSHSDDYRNAISEVCGEQKEKLQFKEIIIIEEYISGNTLGEILNVEHRLDYELASDILLQLLSILKSIQELNPPIIHRDIKPENIIMNSDGKIYLLDFDISRNYKIGSRNDTVPLGTNDYAAPEQYGFMQSDIRTDIYACGVLFNKMLTGKLPKEEPYHGAGSEIIAKCLKFNPEERYQSVDEIINDVTASKNTIV